MNKKGMSEVGMAFLIIGGVLLLIIAIGSFYTIQAGERGVLLTFQKPSMESMGEGLHFKVPLIQTVKKFEVKTMKVEATAAAASNDLQDVNTQIALNYHLIPSEVPKLYQEIGSEYQSRIIDPAIQEAVKAIEARFTAEELVTKRPEVRREIQSFLEDRLKKYYIKVDDFNIINFKFSDSFNAAIEAKQVAEQNALTAERDLQRIKVEAEQEIVRAEADRQAKILRAEGEAESIRIQSSVLNNNPDILELRKIEKWNGVMPITYVSGSDAVPLISI